MLERICGELISATEAFATEQRYYRKDTALPVRRFFFNVVVTTAELKVAQFKPEDISLTDGTLPTNSVHVEDVHYIRFHKQMALRERRFTPDDYVNEVKPDEAKENTVFVVRATALLGFLKAFDIPRDTLLAFGQLPLLSVMMSGRCGGRWMEEGLILFLTLAGDWLVAGSC